MSRAATKRLRPVTSARQARAPKPVKAQEPGVLELLAEVKRLTLALEEGRRGPAPITLAEYLPIWRKRHWPSIGAATRSGYDSVIKSMMAPHLGQTRLADVDEVAITVWQATLKAEGYAGTTRAQAAKVLRTILRVAVRDKRLVAAPEMRIDRGQKEQPWLRPAEYEQLVRAAAAHGDRTLVVVLLGGDAGMRRGEVVGLRFSHVVDGVIMLQEQRSRFGVRPPKYGKVRSVPMTPRLAVVIERLRAQLPDGVEDGHVALNQSGKPLSYNSVTYVLKRALKLAGITKRIKFHSGRHTFISHLGGNNAPLPVIQKLVGHANMATTQIYMHTDEEQAHRAIEALRR